MPVNACPIALDRDMRWNRSMAHVVIGECRKDRHEPSDPLRRIMRRS
jgi:hypothetical protein